MTEQPKHKKNGGARLPDAEKKQTPGSKKKKEKIIMVVMIILAVIMVLAAALAVLYARWVKKPVLPSASGDPTSSPAVSRDPDSTDDPVASDEPEEPDYDPVQPKVSGERKSEDFYTILVFGADETSGLTDTIMVVSYDVTNQKATVMSIPRDTLANTRFSGVDAKKMNAVYKMNGAGEKGIEALKNEVSELIGFMPDYYVMINWELVGQMVDAIGGVWYDIPYHMDYDDVAQDLYIHYDTGYQYLNGADAMNVVRWRKNNTISKYYGEGGGSDLNRLEVQHGFLKAVLQQTLQIQNVTRISKLAELFGENVTSDLTIENLFWFGSQAIFSGLNVDDVEFVTMPIAGIGSYPVKDGSGWVSRDFVYPSQKRLLTLINDGLNPFLNDVTLRELDLIYPNSNGGISSTSGKLADASMAALPAAYLEWKDSEEDPDPSESDPEDSSPLESDPLESDPEESDPVATDDPNGGREPEIPPDPAVSSDPGASETSDIGSVPAPEEDLEIPDWLLPHGETGDTDGE